MKLIEEEEKRYETSDSMILQRTRNLSDSSSKTETQIENGNSILNLILRADLSHVNLSGSKHYK